MNTRYTYLATKLKVYDFYLNLHSTPEARFSYSSIRVSFSWLTLRTLQILLAA